MSTLQETVIDGLTSEGLIVDEDRGGLTVRGGQGDHAVQVWVDETERVVRAEEVLCYPVDDFSEELCMAMDQLNEMRVGVTLSYQEQQRALVASSVWTSPTRSPSPNQLHLMIALLHEAKERDAELLIRVADGEASWSDVAGDLIQDSDSSRIAAPSTTTRFSGAEPPTRAIGNLGEAWAEPPTRPMGQMGASYDNQDALEPALRPSTLDREPTGRRGMSKETRTPPKTSRLAFQMAVNAAAPKEMERADLTLDGRGLGGRLFKGFLILVLILGAVWLLLWKIVKPMYPQPFTWVESFFVAPEVQADPLEVEYARRKAMKPGRGLLEIEIESPGDWKPLGKTDDFLRISLLALGEKAGPTLETLITKLPSENSRERAYELWSREGYRQSPGARLRLLRQLAAVKRPDDRILQFLVNDIRESPLSDEDCIAALEWAPPLAWKAFIVQLGHRGRGSRKRAQALGGQLKLKRDTADAIVLRSLISTGHAPKDALSRLIDKRKMIWAKGVGRQILVDLVKAEIRQAGALLNSSNLEKQVLGVELLTDANTATANKLLIKTLKDRSTPIRVRLAAVNGVKKSDLTSATWTLVVIVCGTKEDKMLQAAAQRSLEGLPAEKAVAKLKPYLVTTKKYATRNFAVRGLGAIKDPVAVQRLIQILAKEREVRVRRLAARVLENYLQEPDGRASLNQGLATFFSVSKNDKDATVRKIAQRLYDSLRGG